MLPPDLNEQVPHPLPGVHCCHDPVDHVHDPLAVLHDDLRLHQHCQIMALELVEHVLGVGVRLEQLQEGVSSDLYS